MARTSIFPLLLLFTAAAGAGVPACVAPPSAPPATSPPAPVVAAVSSTAVAPARPIGAAPKLRRGMNLGNALDAPSEGEWGVVLDASDFVSFQQAGFDHVRLPVRFNAHAAASPPFTVDADFFARVDWAIDQATARGLAIVVDFHHYLELMKTPDEHRARFLAIWKQIAERYAGRPASVAFEILNEPNDQLTADKWNDILAEALRVVRASNPTRGIVVEGANWGSANNLGHTLKIPEGDPNLIGSFHTYQPMLFTHQGAAFMSAEYQTRGVVFPGPPSAPLQPSTVASSYEWVKKWFQRYDTLPSAENPSGPSTIAEELDLASLFAEKTRLPVYMGEFGCNDNADPKSREAWVREARTQAERHGFGWAYWDDGGSFKIYDRGARAFLPSMKAALLE